MPARAGDSSKRSYLSATTSGGRAPRRKRILRTITQRPGGTRKAVERWNSLPDQTRFGNDPVATRRRLRKGLPRRYSVEDDLTIGIPGQKKSRSPQRAIGDPDYGYPPYPV